MMRSTPKTTNAGRKQAQRLFKVLTACESCGGTETLQRHHKDHDTSNNTPENISTLCSKCHGKMHAEQRWSGHTKQRTCANCGKQFTYKRARETTCSRACGNKAAWSLRKSCQE